MKLDKDLFKRLKSFDYKKLLENKKLLKKAAVVIAVLYVILHVRSCIIERRKNVMPPRPVHTALVTKKDVPIYIDSFGTLVPVSEADIKAQVTGEIKEVHFNEGDEVGKADLLFVIDPAQYEAQKQKAEAAVAKDLVDLKLKKNTLKRNKKLFDKQLISEQQYETYQSDAAGAEAQYKLDMANLETAKINLDYCYIKAPFAGLTGKREVDVGNIVTANAGPTLVSLKAIDVLYVDFTVAEKNLADIRKATEGGLLKVRVKLEGDGQKNYEGQLSFLDNTVDNDTGTVLLRATVPNKERELWPGQFVRVRLILRVEEGALVVPYEAVKIGRQGSYLFAVTGDNKADLRTVKPGIRDGDLIVVEKGVAGGEKVVTVGQMGLAPGVPVIDVTTEKEKSK